MKLATEDPKELAAAKRLRRNDWTAALTKEERRRLWWAWQASWDVRHS